MQLPLSQTWDQVEYFDYCNRGTIWFYGIVPWHFTRMEYENAVDWPMMYEVQKRKAREMLDVGLLGLVCSQP